MEIKPGSFIGRCFLNGENCSLRNKLRINHEDVFAIMPFKGRDTVAYAIKEAVEKSGLNYKRADQHQSNIMIPCKVCQQIQSSQYLVGDISEYNPNVFFELGIAFSLGRTVKLIKDEELSTPTDLEGLEYIGFRSSNIPHLIDALKEWFMQSKCDNYQYDQYLLGHLLRTIKMDINIVNYNAEGDCTTKYEIETQKIGLGFSSDTKDMYVMPYHDSVSVDVYDDFFSLDARNSAGKNLPIEHIIASSRLKRFCVSLGHLKIEERSSFTVEMREKQLFDKEESHDWYDVNIIYPTEQLKIAIAINPEWEIARAWMCYGESFGDVKAELIDFSNTSNKISAVLNRPKVGLTYMIRWEWK